MDQFVSHLSLSGFHYSTFSDDPFLSLLLLPISCLPMPALGRANNFLTLTVTHYCEGKKAIRERIFLYPYHHSFYRVWQRFNVLIRLRVWDTGSRNHRNRTFAEPCSLLKDWRNNFGWPLPRPSWVAIANILIVLQSAQFSLQCGTYLVVRGRPRPDFIAQA